MAPTDYTAVLGQDQPEQFRWMQWGLIPHWAPADNKLPHPINARAETVAEKPLFRDAFRRGRCLVPALWYFEWEPPEQKGRSKQPYKIRPADQAEGFAFAGLSSSWRPSPEAAPIRTFTLVTVPAAADIAHLHDRMPLILRTTGEAEQWLKPEVDAAELEALMAPYAGPMAYYPISTLLNNPRNDTPEILNPPGQEGLFG